MQSARFCSTGHPMQHTLLCMRQKSSMDAVLAACMLLIYLNDIDHNDDNSIDININYWGRWVPTP